ncbi:MAG: LysM peptidoglycan-binding domain-containing protein [Planctomycetaceae bacterium]
MGILLIGVVAALFFRNEPLAEDEGLSARRQVELNQRLRDRDVAVYLEPDLPETDEPGDGEPEWTLSELFDQARQASEAPLPIGGQRPVEPAVPSVAAVVPAERLTFTPPPELNDVPEDADIRTADEESDAPSLADVLSGTAKESPPATAKTDIPFEEYTVKFGDTLSGISERFLGAQSRYRELYEMNRDRMESPDRLKVGKAIRVPRVQRF